MKTFTTHKIINSVDADQLRELLESFIVGQDTTDRVIDTEMEIDGEEGTYYIAVDSDGNSIIEVI